MRPDERADTGPDFLQLSLAGRPAGLGVTNWLAERLRHAMDGGELADGARLPTSRDLAADLGVSRGVVTEVYRRLGDEGRLVGRGRAGTVVRALRPSRPAAGAVRTSVAIPQRLFAREAESGLVDELRERAATFDLTPGRPDLSAFPRAAWLRAEKRVLQEIEPDQLGYQDASGTMTLRRNVADWLARNRAMAVEPSEVIIVAGVAQALTLISQLLHRRGRCRLAVEDPGSLGSREAMRSWGMQLVPVPVDAHGLDVGALTAADADAVMVTPAHQFPTGVPLAPDRRTELVEWAGASDGLIIEDDYDAEHRYDRAPVPALRSLAPELVCYTGSVSKVLSPALRIGWLVPPAHLYAELAALKRDSDLGNAALNQLTLAAMMEDGSLERHLRSVRRLHRRRRDAMIGALQRWLPEAVVHGAAAGLHLTITLPDHVDDKKLAAQALDQGVKLHPLSWHAATPGPPGLVLGYAAIPPTKIDEALELVGRLTATKR